MFSQSFTDVLRIESSIEGYTPSTGVPAAYIFIVDPTTGEGDGLGLGDGGVLGEGVGDGVITGDGLGTGVGEATGLGVGLRLGVGAGVGELLNLENQEAITSLAGLFWM